MVIVVVLEPLRNLCQDRLCVRTITGVNIFSLECLDERPRHAVRPWRSHWREAWYEDNRPGEVDRVVNAVAAAIIRNPFDRTRGCLFAKASLDAIKHQIADNLAGNTTDSGDSGHHVAITDVECEGNSNALSVAPDNLEAVRHSSEVRADGDDLTVVRAFMRLAGAALQRKRPLCDIRR